MKCSARIAVYSILLVAAGCAGFNQGAVRNLTEAEIRVLDATRSRLAANERGVFGALDDLSDNLRFALDHQHRLASNIAKAQLLESMKSPWTSANLTPTQKEVALYHLFALEEAEQAALGARIARRQAGIAELKSSYRRLVSSLSTLIAAQEQLLVHLNQPATAQIGTLLQQVLEESKAFRAALDDSDDPRLQRLAERVAAREQDVADAEQRIVTLLERIEED